VSHHKFCQADLVKAFAATLAMEIEKKNAEMGKKYNFFFVLILKSHM